MVEEDGRDSWDVVVLGAGPVGENVAARAVERGLSAILIEGDLAGGACSYHACVPSKALLRAVDARDGAVHVAGTGVSGTAIDVAAVLGRRDAFVNGYQDDSQVEWIAHAGIDLLRGTGKIVGERQVEVRGPDVAGGSRMVQARHAVVVATGSTAHRPDVPGAQSPEVWTSHEALAATSVPRSVVIVGGGVVALETATIFCGLGAEVHVLLRSRLLSAFEPFVGPGVRSGLERRGVRFSEGEVSRIDIGADGQRVVTRSNDVFSAERVILATGRRAAVADIGLDRLGLRPAGPHGGIDVDDTLRARGTDWLYACGDANGRAMLTHQGKYQAVIAADVIAERAAGNEPDAGEWDNHHATADHDAVSQVVFSAPQVASAGLTLQTAQSRGLDARPIDVDLGSVAGAALHRDGYQGRARLVVDNQSDRVLGATFVGPDVAELAYTAAVVVASGVTVGRLKHAVPPFPTMSEIWLRLLAAA